MGEDNQNLELYEPSDKDYEALQHVYDRLYKMHYIRNRNYAYFNDRSVLAFIDDSMKRWNGYIPFRDDLTDEWQARVFVNLTRDTVNSFLSKVAMAVPKTQIVARNNKGFDDTKRAFVISKLYDYSREKEKGEQKFFNCALESTTKGTVIAHEGYRKIKRKVKEITKYDPVTGKIEYKEKEVIDYNDCWRSVIPLEDFFIGNIWQPEMQLQPDVIWKTVVRKVEAQEEFQRYPNWKFVKPGAMTTLIQQFPFFKNVQYAELDNDQVEIIRYYNRLKDWMCIIINGVVIYNGCIPFNHKRYPFARGIFEPFASDFFYGNSLPNKIAMDNDIINTLWAMMLDQTMLSIHKPVLTDDPDEMEDTVLIPGLVKKVNNKESFRIMDELKGPEASHFNMLQLAMNYGNEHSGFMKGGGSASSPTGGGVTARQALMQEEQARQVLGLNSKYLEYFEMECAKLRIPVILQFYTLPEKNKAITGEDENMSLFYRTIRVDDTELSDGTYGTAIIKIAPDQQSLPTADSLDVEEEMASMQGNNTEIKAVTAEYLRNVEFDVSIVPQSSYLQKKSLEQAMGTEFYTLMSQNPIIDQVENTREMIILYEKDPDKFIKQQPQGQQPGMDMASMQAQMGKAPQGNMTGNKPPSAQINTGVLGMNQ